ncbi:MAG: hypothetical protein L0Y72_28465 [Gemmataceae bacterium]|nr:hypothetical protein [Gemmataceae bacterium]
MPLSEKARIEVYLPDKPAEQYRNLLDTFEEEFTYAFGGATVARGLQGKYLSLGGRVVADQVNMLYSDAPFSFEGNREKVARFADRVRIAAYEALNEEAILIVVYGVHHSVRQS